MVTLFLLLMGLAFSLVVLFNIVKESFGTWGSQVAAAAAAAPVAKKFRVKITGNHGEKLVFSSLQENDIKQVVETLVSLQQEKKKSSTD